MSGEILRWNLFKERYVDRSDHHHTCISVMELGHLLTRSGLTYPEVSSKFCQLENSVTLPWVTITRHSIYMLYPVSLVFQQFFQNWCYF